MWWRLVGYGDFGEMEKLEIVVLDYFGIGFEGICNYCRIEVVLWWILDMFD